MFRMKEMGCASTLALGLFSAAHAYPIDCAIFLCLAGGWPSSPDCNAARAEFVRRITPYPVEPPLQLWRCPMGAAAGSSNLTPMQRLEAIKETSAIAVPELPTDTNEASHIVEASYSDGAWAGLGVEAPTLPAPTLAAVDLSSSDFDVVRSIRVFDVQHYSFRKRERDGPCSARLRMYSGSYDEDTAFHWRKGSPGRLPAWLPLHRQCGWRFRGVGVEWTDRFGRYDYELIPY